MKRTCELVVGAIRADPKRLVCDHMQCLMKLYFCYSVLPVELLDRRSV